MSHHRTIAALVAIATAAGLAGCGIPAPQVAAPGTQATATQTPPATTSARSSSAPSSGTALKDAIPRPERGGSIPNGARRAQNQLTAGAGVSSPVQALSSYARLWATWTAQTIVTSERRLARVSLGQARAQALQAAASFAADTKLTDSHVANSGQAIAITKGRGTAAGQWVVVTSETTTGSGQYAGLPATLHVTYAQLTRRAGAWVVSSWSPQN